MVTVTRAGSTLACYKNGPITARDTAFSATFSKDTTVRIGNSTVFDEPTYGGLDDVRIYSRALSATEVKQLYNAGR